MWNGKEPYHIASYHMERRRIVPHFNDTMWKQWKQLHWGNITAWNKGSEFHWGKEWEQSGTINNNVGHGTRKQIT
jgi:hypothetical protein